MIGPVYQCFDGLPSQRDSGLLRMVPTNARGDIQKTLSAIKEISQTVVELMGCASQAIQGSKKGAFVPGRRTAGVSEAESSGQPSPGPGWRSHPGQRSGGRRAVIASTTLGGSASWTIKGSRPESSEVVLSVPEIRDYRAINGELVRLLDQGCRAIRLEGANGQRLLASRLEGSWAAAIEVVGDAGPELAAEMDAPNLTVVCRASVGDGGASRLIAGHILILGRAGPAFGYAQRGGLAMVVGTAGRGPGSASAAVISS